MSCSLDRRHLCSSLWATTEYLQRYELESRQRVNTRAELKTNTLGSGGKQKKAKARSLLVDTGDAPCAQWSQIIQLSKDVKQSNQDFIQTSNHGAAWFIKYVSSHPSSKPKSVYGKVFSPSSIDTHTVPSL